MRWGWMLVWSAVLAAQTPVGTTRQLFVDERLIAAKQNVSLVLHPPVAREVVLKAEKPWEGQSMTYPTVFHDGKQFRLYYRASGPKIGSPVVRQEGDKKQMMWSYTALALSDDGVKWTRPELGVVAFDGSKKNNLVWPPAGEEGSDVLPFLDKNPAAKAEERYKALASVGEFAVIALGSPDGIHWKRMQKEPVLSHLPVDPMMDPPNLAFWDEGRKEYVAYLRCWLNYRIRSFRRCTSKDFIHWSAPEYVDFGDAPVEHLYTNMTTPYERVPGMYFMFAKRFVPWRHKDPAWPYDGLSECVFLSSRDGLHFDRTFLEPFIRPGPDKDNWHDRNMMAARGILQTAADELSLYYFEHYRTDGVRIRRATVRPDGFVSVTAPFAGGEFTTRPFVLEGDELELNYSTSVAGSVRVEIQDEGGHPIPAFRLEDCDELYGDELDRVVTWRRGHKEVLAADGTTEIPFRPSQFGRALQGRTVRLRFVMKAAEVFSFRVR